MTESSEQGCPSSHEDEFSGVQHGAPKRKRTVLAGKYQQISCKELGSGFHVEHPEGMLQYHTSLSLTTRTPVLLLIVSTVHPPNEVGFQ